MNEIYNGYIKPKIKSAIKYLYFVTIIFAFIFSIPSSASSYVSGDVTGSMSSDNQQIAHDNPNTTFLIEINELGRKVNTVLINGNFWRFDQISEKYFTCLGVEDFYRKYGRERRCRTKASGFSGFLGSLNDSPELEISDYLTFVKGRAAKIIGLKVIDEKNYSPRLFVTFTLGEQVQKVVQLPIIEEPESINSTSIESISSVLGGTLFYYIIILFCVVCIWQLRPRSSKRKSTNRSSKRKSTNSASLKSDEYTKIRKTTFYKKPKIDTDDYFDGDSRDSTSNSTCSNSETYSGSITSTNTVGGGGGD